MRAALCLIVLVALAQGAEIRDGRIETRGIAESIVSRLHGLLESSIKGVRDLVLSLIGATTNTINQAIGALSSAVTNALDTVNSLIEEAKKIGKEVESCASIANQLKTVRDRVQEKVTKCRKTSDLSLSLVNGGLNDAESSGTAYISQVLATLQQCWSNSAVIPCLSSVISSATNTIQTTVDTIGQLSQIAVVVASEGTLCINSAVGEGTNETVRIVNEVKTCLASI